VIRKEKIEFSIIGAGRFGTFWGAHLSKHYPVYFFDVDDSKRPQIDAFASWESLNSCLAKDYIFLTIPIGRMASFLQVNGPKIRAGSVVIDCASVKEPVIEWFEKYVPTEIGYAASHPLFGPDSAREGLTGHTITLIPGRIPYNKYRTLVKIFSNLLNLRVLNVTPQEHDKLMAYNLSLVHHLGRTFHKMQIFKLPLIMAGLKNLNQISQVIMNDSDELFEDFYKYNSYSEGVRIKFLNYFREITSSINE